MGHPRTILFDGDCAFCNGWVRWIMQRDRGGRFRFVPQASQEGIALRKSHNVPLHVDSIVFLEANVAYVRSDAAWRVLATLPGWGLTATFLRLVPRPLRNWGYDVIARNRHRFGGRAHCELPGPPG